jgi:hypothetical protein
VDAFRQLLTRPRIGARIVAAVLTVAGLLPLLARLPKVAVVACFGAGHPLYEWVPAAPFVGTTHCFTGPAPAVTWTLMIAATFVVQLLALPLLLSLGAVMVRGARHLVHAAGQALTQALVGLSDILLPTRRPAPVYVRVRSNVDGYRSNPRRGPPTCP